MQIDRYVVGMFYTNTYLLTINDECILIDPASKPEKLIEVLGNKKLLAILLTHGHFDHIKAVDGLVKEYNCPVYINENDEIVLVDYKTDYVEKGKEEELVKKYKKQLELYSRALEEALGKKVSKCWIYSVWLEKLVEIV